MGKLSNAKKLTKTEQYAIEGMSSNGMKPAAIAQALGRDPDLVSEYIDLYDQESKTHTTINTTANGNRGVAIMTEASSQRVDAMRNQAGDTHKNTSSIHKIK
tara:strand:- start:546 stop:851 length:306 start_codon:yes stop_codon:yes gene_type:complete